MAEATQYYLEQMLPELDDFERRRIFTKSEIKQIVRNRTALESAIHVRGPKKQSYLKYIEYEVNLESLRRKRKKRFGLNVAPQKGEKGISLSDYSILKRIHSLYQKCLKKFHGDEELWMQYFKWASDVGSSKTLGHMFARAIQLHPNNVTFFILSASWEFEQIGNIDSARAIFQSGLRINAKSQKLWIEYYKMELLYLEKIRQRQVLLSAPSADGNAVGLATVQDEALSTCYKTIPEVVYKNAIAAMSLDFDFCMQFLVLSRKFPKLFNNDYTFFIDSIASNFNTVEQRDALCKSFFVDVTKDIPETELVAAFELSTGEYEKAIRDIPSLEMWSCFVLFLQTLKTEFCDSCLQEVIECMYDDVIMSAKENGFHLE